MAVLGRSSLAGLFEVLPALRLEFAGLAAGIEQRHFPVSDNVADFGDTHARDPRRHWLAAWCGEEQLVVIPAVQRELKVDLVSRTSDAGARNCLRLNLRANSTFIADMGEIGGEAVADVNHRGNQTFFPQNASNCNPRHGMEVVTESRGTKFLARRQQLQGSCGTAQLACHINTIPGAGTRTPDCFASGNRADDHNIRQNPAW